MRVPGEIPGGNESEAGDEIVELGGRHVDGDEEDGAIGRNQRPCDDGWISRCHRILDREHRSGTILRDHKAEPFSSRQATTKKVQVKQCARRHLVARQILDPAAKPKI
jgi:hypothetical protein